MDKLPWFPFYGRDFFGDEQVKLFTLRQVGMYTYLLWHQWEHGSIPPADECRQFALVQAAHCEAWQQNFINDPSPTMTVFNELTQVHQTCFQRHPTLKHRYINTRLEKIRAEQLQKYEQNHQRAVRGGLARSSAQAQLKQTSKLADLDLDSEKESEKIEEKKEESLPLKNGHAKGKRAINEFDCITEKHRLFAQQIGIDPGPEWGKFKNYCLAHDKRYANFEAAFRNWLANAKDMKGARP